MNVSPSGSPSHMSTLHPVLTATQAIISGNTMELAYLTGQGLVDASTRIENGETLLMFAVRHTRLDAFQTLFETLVPDRLGEQYLEDHDGNTVFHHFALHLNDADFAPTEVPAPWHECLFALQEGDYLGNGWERQNLDGDTPIDLAGGHKEQLVDFMMSSLPDQ